MAQRNQPPLKLGGANIRIAGRLAGQVINPVFSMTNQKLEHQTNYAPRYKKDAIFAIMSSVNISWAFQHIVPANVNVLLGQPGYGLPMLDPKLGGQRPPMDLYTALPLQEIEYPVLADSAENQMEWSYLQYPMYNPDAAAPAPATNVYATNTSTPGTIIGYRGFAAALAINTGLHFSIPSNISVVPIFNATTDTVVVRVYFPTGTTADRIQVYRFVYTFNATYQTYIGTFAAACIEDAGAGATVFTILPGDITAGYKDITITLGTALLTEAGHPVTPITVVDLVTGSTLSWLTDFEYNPAYQGGSAIKRVPTGAISVDEPVRATYYYNGAAIAEAPIGSNSTNNPVVPITMDSLFPDGLSKIIIKLWAVQTLPNQLSMAFSENDWMNLPFSGEALDRANVYPNFPFGQIQFTGPIAQRVKKFGNLPWGQTGYDLALDQTSWA